MKILIFTQTVDKQDPILGFFHDWIGALSLSFESVEVICLSKGEFNLPNNVTVYSLGKERGVSKFGYVINLYKYLYLISGSYDAVFVHMNQEYVILSGIYWKIKKIPVYFWRNHPHGNIFTYIAVFLSTKVFCTAPNSFTARFKKTNIMPVGYNSDLLRPTLGIVRKKYSVLMLGRVSPVKNIDLGIKAISYLIRSGVQVSLSIVGSPTQKDVGYYNGLKKMVEDLDLSTIITFKDEVAKNKTPEIFSSHEVFLNLTDSFDKTIVESTACGAIPLVSNKTLSCFLPTICVTENSVQSIANSIEKILDPQQQIKIQKDLVQFAKSQSLGTLISKLTLELK